MSIVSRADLQVVGTTVQTKALAVGNIVVVDMSEAHPIPYPDSKYNGKQGRIVHTHSKDEEGPIGVVFPEYYNLFYSPDPPGSVVHFQPDELKKLGRDDPQDRSVEEMCTLLFGRMWTNVWLLDKPLMIGFDECPHEGCDKTVVARIMVNNHGTVSEIDVCKKHMEYHGRNCDGFEMKQPSGQIDVDEKLPDTPRVVQVWAKGDDLKKKGRGAQYLEESWYYPRSDRGVLKVVCWAETKNN